ncbi:MAG: sigma 54-interacting transcriptional regulator, partial [Polyangiaceae bacterium]|nr:sigma 54-interacting transcriptional regulator [Polyangiaceae bacterium]
MGAREARVPRNRTWGRPRAPLGERSHGRRAAIPRPRSPRARFPASGQRRRCDLRGRLRPRSQGSPLAHGPWQSEGSSPPRVPSEVSRLPDRGLGAARDDDLAGARLRSPVPALPISAVAGLKTAACGARLRGVRATPKAKGAGPGPELEKELASLDRPAILLDADYRIVAANAAYRAHYGRAPRLGHDRCFAVSHGYDSPCDRNGEDCPLGRARISKQRERVFHVHLGRDRPEHVDVELRPILDGKGDVRFFLETIGTIPQASADAEGGFVGRSRAFLELIGLLRRAAPSEVPVLLLGESGTGKELAARAIHEASARAAGPFVAVECSGLGEALFESELFGHAKGAFTGAQAQKAGLVDAAAHGTLFLDEIGDVPLSLQVKLLRLLESGTYRAVGEVRTRKADFRLVCATHRDLKGMVADGRFRQDL